MARRAPPQEVEYERLPGEAKARLLENGRRRDTVGLGGANPLTGVWRPVLPEVGGPPG